jgi:light-regulated signal transduction histidine kinase (bacteriophytochrome)
MKALLDYWEDTERGGGSLSPVDCNQVLSQTLRNLQTEIRQSGATVTSDPLPTVVAEHAPLGKVFQTLVSNSIAYRDQAALKIHVSAVRTYDRWLFSVRDNGIGIDPKDAEWVFGMFNRLHGNEIPGTGIGLALCKKVVERHGGRIWVESRTGQGAAFRFTIPTYLDAKPPS